MIFEYFTKNRIISNLLTILSIFFGIYAAFMINVQYIPPFNPDILTINIEWQGATSREVYDSIIKPVQNELRNTPNLVKIMARASDNYANFVIEYTTGSNLDEQLEDLKNRLNIIKLPKTIDKIQYVKPTQTEDLLGVVLYGPEILDEMRYYAKEFETELLNKDIDYVVLHGLPDQKLMIELSREQYTSMGITLSDIAEMIYSQSNDISIGEFETNSTNVNIKSSGKLSTIKQFELLKIGNPDKKIVVPLKQISNVSWQDEKLFEKVYFNGKPAVTINISRLNQNGGHILNQATSVDQFINDVKSDYPSTLKVESFAENWKKIYNRINILFKNGVFGFIGIIILLNLFFYRTLAFWVACAIPIAISAAIFMLYTLGGSINFLSTFALIMSLGIVVDDTIVVAEQAYTNLQAKMKPFDAVISSVNFMFKPIIASSLTTICAFIPLLMIKGLFGQILFDIPFIVICIIAASILECFFILPHHLYVSFLKQRKNKLHQMRTQLDRTIRYIQFTSLKNGLTKLFNYPSLCLVSVSMIIFTTIFALTQGFPKFEFFPSPPANILMIKTIFNPGTSEKQRSNYQFDLENIIQKVNGEIGSPIKNIIVGVSSNDPYIDSVSSNDSNYNPRYGYLILDTINADKREISNDELFDVIKKKVVVDDHIKSIQYTKIGSGPSESDLKIMIQGKDPENLKKASLQLQNVLSEIKGVNNINDDFPYGMEEYILTVKPEAQLYGYSNSMISNQVRDIISGRFIHDFSYMGTVVNVKIALDQNDINKIKDIASLPIIGRNGQITTLDTIADINIGKSFDNYNSYNGVLTVLVSAEVDRRFNNSGMIINELKKDVFPTIESNTGARFNLEEQSRYGKEALEEIKFGAVIGLLLIYAILSWTSDSFLWPFLLMLVIPFGLTGAILGHILLGYDMTLMSIFGMFGLTGIVVNNSIILLHRFKQIQKQFPRISHSQKIIKATCQRFRSIVLTTLTTIVGLTPLLFETSRSAQFLIPMAISITFGLILANVLLILVLPILMNMRKFFINFQTKKEN